MSLTRCVLTEALRTTNSFFYEKAFLFFSKLNDLGILLLRTVVAFKMFIYCICLFRVDFKLALKKNFFSKDVLDGIGR